MQKTLLLAEETTRHLPVPPIVFGLFTFAVLGFALYLVLRLGR